MSVSQWIVLSSAVCQVLRRELEIAIEVYVDDFVAFAPVVLTKLLSEVMLRMMKCMGIMVHNSKAKHGQTAEVLGAFLSIVDGKLQVQAKESRRLKIIQMLEKVINDKSCHSSVLKSLVGKCFSLRWRSCFM